MATRFLEVYGLIEWASTGRGRRDATRDREGRDAVAELEAQLAEAHAEIERLQAEVARLSEENRAFVSSVKHMTSAAEQVLEEARREAAETRARVAAEAYERLVVARADARAAVHEERQRLAAELELLAAVRERIEDERNTLSVFQNQLSGRLRDLVRAVFDFEERSPSLPPGPSWEGNEAHTVADERGVDDSRPSATNSPADYVDAVVIEDREEPKLTIDPADEAEEELEAAFAAFFHADIEGEPSRHWILDGR